MVKQSFHIRNMMCAMCVAHVRKAIEGLDGVKDVNVNLASNSALIEFDESKITPQQIREAVVAAGYDMDTTPLSAASDNSEDEKKKSKGFLGKLFGR
ncbi:MAG: heavy-metal-associated domain-containing protein [Bacteroidales bacterium]|nr:heavy-metal-associated domain-containing protein [Bacteroidales bacterium]